MTSSAPSAPAVTLYRCPGALGLPSVDPSAIAAETVLRFAQTRFARKEARLRDLALHVAEGASGTAAASSPSPPAVMRGVEQIVKGVGAPLDTAVLTSELRPVAASVEALTTKCLYPAFVFAVLYDYRTYRYAIAKSVVPKVGTLWESLRGSFRAGALRENAYFYGSANAGGDPPSSASLSITQTQVLMSVLEEAARALQSLELLIGARRGNGQVFFLGTETPSSTDALAYAGASCFLHADFATMMGGRADEVLSPTLQKFQARVREECPLLLNYVERVRVLLYDDLKGSYNLRPTIAADALDGAGAAQAAGDLYSRGRFKTLFWTSVFAAVYFVIVNADLLAAMAEELSEAEEEEEAAEEAAAASTAAGRPGGQSS